MNQRQLTCDSNRITLFLERALNDLDQAAFEAHLTECQTCCRQLESAAADRDVWEDVRDALAETAFGDEPAVSDCEQAEDFGHRMVLDLLAPTDDDRMLGRLGAYEIAGVIGRGGMGIVLKGLDPALHRYVAIKVLAPDLAVNGAARKRFSREAQAAAAVVHENVIEIYGVADDAGLPYIVMSYIRGTPLQRRLDDEGPLQLVEVLRIGMQVAAGLSAAHAQGLVHRDVKPANILLADGVERVKLTDFGLARATDDATLTRSGIIAGTPQYMSPEQARGDSIDHRSDLFSLGSVLYAMCTGRPPFRAPTPFGVLARITNDAPTPIRDINSEIPDWLSNIILQLLAKHPEDRFASATEVAQLLEACLAHVQQPTVVALPRHQRPWSHRQFSVTRRGVITMLAAAGLVFLGMVLGSTHSAPDISGAWAGTGWGNVTLKAEKFGRYSGTYTDTHGPDNGTIKLKWSVLERQYKGSWREGNDRFGKISVRLDGNQLRGAWTTSKKSRINPGNPSLTDLSWNRGHREAFRATPPSNTIKPSGKLNDTPHDSLALLFHTELPSRVHAMAHSPDGKTVAIGIKDQVRLHDASTGQHQRTLELINDDEESAFSDDAIIGVFHAQRTRVAAQALAFSPDSNVLVVGTSIGQVKLFLRDSGQFLRALDDVDRDNQEHHPLPPFLDLPLAHRQVSALAISGDGKFLASAGSPVDYKLDGVRRLGAGPNHGVLKVWDLNSGNLLADLKGEHNNHVLDVQFSPDGKLLASAGNWRSNRSFGSGVKVWDMTTRQVRKILVPPQHAGTPLSLDFSPDGTRIVVGTMEYDKVTDVTSGRISVYFPASGILNLTWLTLRSARPVAYARDGAVVAAFSGKDELTLWNASTGQSTATLRPHAENGASWNGFSLSPREDVVVLSGLRGRNGFLEAYRLRER